VGATADMWRAMTVPPALQDNDVEAAMPRTTSSASEATVSDDGPHETPSLGAQLCITTH